MNKRTVLPWLVGTAITMVVAMALTSTTAASQRPDPAAVSTPTAPEGGGVVVGSGATIELGDTTRIASRFQHMLGALGRSTRVERHAASTEGPPDRVTGGLSSGAGVDLDQLAQAGAARSSGAVRPGGASPATALGALGTTQLLENPGFETGSWAPWGFWSNGSSVPTLSTAFKHAGAWSVHMGYELGTLVDDTCYPDLDQIFQTIAVPAGSLEAVTIEFWYRSNTEETYANYDLLCPIIWNEDGTAAFEPPCIDLAEVGSLDWTKATWTLTDAERNTIAGRTLDFGFHFQNDCTQISRAWVDDVAFTVTTVTAPEEECVTLLRNPQLDVVELGDGTGTIEYWTILSQIVYYSTEDYQSPQYSLTMVDDDDPSHSTSGPDRDEFGQGFAAPMNLTQLRINYSRRFVNANTGDEAYSVLWTLTDDYFLDEPVDGVLMGEEPEAWTNRYWELTQPGDAVLLSQLSGRPLAVTFLLLGDRAEPREKIWLDDIQVTACYQRATNTVFLPAVLRNFGLATGPVCVDLEPDSVTARGHTDLGAVCNSSFSPVDQRDYYSLRMLAGVSEVRLKLFNLPSGTNWDALIYEDAAGYPLACHIGTPGSADKQKDCTLNPAKSYFVLVNAGAAPEPNKTTYQMSVTRR